MKKEFFQLKEKIGGEGMEVYLLLSNNKIMQNVISPIVLKISNKG